jgi:predicted homoserine dehydrogenase-like protein
MGLQPLVCGNIKGMLDLYRTPETQKGFAAQWGQTPEMVTSFADGTKISFEQAIVANATGMCVAERGMSGPEYRDQIDGLVDFYDVDRTEGARRRGRLRVRGDAQPRRLRLRRP